MKPAAYRVPLMEEIRRGAWWNGLRAISTFSGGGGSSCGYAMAGYDVLWANEFVPHARATYMRNFPTTTLDSRDVREVTAADVMRATGLRPGELDLLDGSPPCQRFSDAGNKAAKTLAKPKRYEGVGGAAKRVDDLFDEFVRLVGGLKPRAFVGENVSGMVTGNGKHYLREVMGKLTGHGYRVRAATVDAQWLGIPQRRQRVFVIGVRNDLEAEPPMPKPFPWRWSVGEALRGLPSPSAEDVARLSFDRFAIGPEWRRLVPGTKSDRYYNLIRSAPEEPCPTLTASAGIVGAASVTHWCEPRKFTIPELRRISSFPDDFVLEGTYKQQVEVLGNAVPPLMTAAVGRALAEVLIAAT